MVHLTRLLRLDDEFAAPATQRAHEVVVDCSCRQKRRDGKPSGPRRAIREDENGSASADGGVGSFAKCVQAYVKRPPSIACSFPVSCRPGRDKGSSTEGRIRFTVGMQRGEIGLG